ncbi:MAG: coproporphyrinogen-III oxidase family protein [Bacteriovoracia bacterium]
MTQVSSLYLHIPFCQHLCNYCDFYKRKLENSPAQFEEFHQFLKASLIQHQKLLQQHQVEWEELETVYLGGGTPSLWGAKGAEFFKALLPVGMNQPEFTMEVDPGTWNQEMFDAWKEIGLNRISIGTQTLDRDFLKVMDRIHSLEDSLNLLEKMQKERWNYSLDFLLGIPFSKEKKRDIQRELDTFLSYEPKHVSLYILNARSKYLLVQNIPDDDYIREEYLFVSGYLKSKGFHHYEVSNFALPGFESKHNQKYWRGESVAALGPTGTGYLKLSQEKALRYKWKVTKPEVEVEMLGKEELELERTYLSLRTSDGWAPAEVTPKMNNLFLKWSSLGYGEWKNQKITLTSEGFVILDSLMDDLFRI